LVKASKDPQVMNLQMFRYSKLLVKLNKSVADELSQPTGFPGEFFKNCSSSAHSNKTAGFGFYKKTGCSEPRF